MEILYKERTEICTETRREQKKRTGIKLFHRPPRMLFAGLLAVGVVSVFSPSKAVGQAVRNLSDLNGSNGFRLQTGATNDNFGRSLSGAGDVNGDGIADLIVGASLADPGGNDDAGSSYIVFGKAAGWGSSENLSTLDGTNGFRIDGVASYNYSGQSVSGAGDVNGDGFADLIIGANGYVYVVFGKATGWAPSLDLSTLDGTNGFRLDSEQSNDGFGRSVSGAGDINGDGFADIAIGAPDANQSLTRTGASYVIFGKASGWAASQNVSTLDGTNGFRLTGAGFLNFSGTSISGAGDVNGDGFADLIVGAASGWSYVIFGKATGWSASMVLSSLDGTNGFRLGGAATGENFGRCVSGAGDINGDGFADLIIGANSAAYNGSSSGSSYIVFGKASGWDATQDLSILDGSNGFRLDGAAQYDSSGISVSGAGDVNGDGFSDLIVGAQFTVYDPIPHVGSTYVIYGKSSSWSASHNLSFLDGTNGFRIDGAAEQDKIGFCVSSAGDINGDGFSDIIIGTQDRSFGYVVFGAGDTGGSGTYKSVTAAGDSPKTPVGNLYDGSESSPASRVWLDFDGGDSVSNETVTVTRNKSGISTLEPIADVAEVIWEISTTRTGWNNAIVTLKYTDAEIAGIGGSESGLTIFKAPAPSGPWTRQTTTVNTVTNEASATVDAFSYFALGASNVPVHMTQWEIE